METTLLATTGLKARITKKVDGLLAFTEVKAWIDTVDGIKLRVKADDGPELIVIEAQEANLNCTPEVTSVHNGRYTYLRFYTLEVHIKLDDEGIIIDVWEMPDGGFSLGTAAIDYSDIMASSTFNGVLVDSQGKRAKFNFGFDDGKFFETALERDNDLGSLPTDHAYLDESLVSGDDWRSIAGEGQLQSYAQHVLLGDYTIQDMI